MDDMTDKPPSTSSDDTPPLTLGRNRRIGAAAIRDGVTVRDECVSATGRLRWGGFVLAQQRERLRVAGYRYVQPAREWRRVKVDMRALGEPPRR